MTALTLKEVIDSTLGEMSADGISTHGKKCSIYCELEEGGKTRYFDIVEVEHDLVMGCHCFDGIILHLKEHK